MLSFAMLRHVTVVRTDVSEELVTANVVPSSLIPFTLMMEAMFSSKRRILQ
jgi:hypothetical protein